MEKNEKAEKIANRLRQTFKTGAQERWRMALADAVMTILERQDLLSLEALQDELTRKAEDAENDMTREMSLAAIERLAHFVEKADG